MTTIAVTDANGIRGMSGSPLLDAEGKLLRLIYGGFGKLDPSAPGGARQTTICIRPASWPALREI